MVILYNEIKLISEDVGRMLYPLAETTECDFKRELETKKPKSWLKSVGRLYNQLEQKIK